MAKFAGYEPHCGIFSTMKGLGGHGHIFCSALQFKACYELLVRVVEEVLKPKQALESENTAAQKNTGFEVKTKALKYVQAPGNFNSGPRVKKMQQIFVTECAIRFWRRNFLHVRCSDV